MNSLNYKKYFDAPVPPTVDYNFKQELDLNTMHEMNWNLDQETFASDPCKVAIKSLSKEFTIKPIETLAEKRTRVLNQIRGKSVNELTTLTLKSILREFNVSPCGKKQALYDRVMNLVDSWTDRPHFSKDLMSHQVRKDLVPNQESFWLDNQPLLGDYFIPVFNDQILDFSENRSFESQKSDPGGNP
ncbi:hypothetical protein O9G_000862 [Rozella allomycis CSF55]|uniref:SAP domain-containing protein n=1 Tax=Rozella allomycis (strain CSF55) TaxID=988480 RepID=A0A075AVP6_ROZAC|nr:hypothetical protein O9G_000862 [Rozella allomycis CSF55]|eukprot:EPZ32787.1 hypothetical protein O9G_000862 [Rozella allomycis CSF55]